MIDPQDPRDPELLKPGDESPLGSPHRRLVPPWAWAAGLLALAAVALFFFFNGRRAVPASARPSPPAAAGAPEQPEAAAPIALPPVDQSDPLVRELVGKLSSHPRIAAWLATDGLIRNFVVVVASAAAGKTPARDLGPLRPSSRFQVVERRGALIVDPRSYHRYDDFAAAAASVDPDGAARLYRMLRPRLEEAYGDLHVSDAPFDRALERAIVVLLETPIVDDPIRVETNSGVGYRFADPELEALAPAQKQLLRMGAANVRSIQSSLRKIAVALGIPAERLPNRG